MKRRYYNPFLERTRARAAEGRGHAEDGGPANPEAQAAEAGTPAPLRAPLPQNWYLLPPGMSVTMALARLPLATRRVVRRGVPGPVLRTCSVPPQPPLCGILIWALRPAQPAL